jgi:hypothetical protein
VIDISRTQLHADDPKSGEANLLLRISTKYATNILKLEVSGDGHITQIT